MSTRRIFHASMSSLDAAPPRPTSIRHEMRCSRASRIGKRELLDTTAKRVSVLGMAGICQESPNYLVLRKAQSPRLEAGTLLLMINRKSHECGGEPLRTRWTWQPRPFRSLAPLFLKVSDMLELICPFFEPTTVVSETPGTRMVLAIGFVPPLHGYRKKEDWGGLKESQRYPGSTDEGVARAQSAD